jgi:hypothetical protein
MPPREDGAALREEEGATLRATTTITSRRGRRRDDSFEEEEDDLDFDRTLALGTRFFFVLLSLSLPLLGKIKKRLTRICRSLSLQHAGSSGWLFIYYVGVIKILRREGYAECVFFYSLSLFVFSFVNSDLVCARVFVRTNLLRSFF